MRTSHAWVFGILSAGAVLLGTTSRAFADAELRLYEGAYEWDLKDRIAIRSNDGGAVDEQFRKVCSAFGGCKAVRSNSDEAAQLPVIAAPELAAMNTAIAGLSATGEPASTTPSKTSLCVQFKRFVYEVKNAAGKIVKTEEIAGCTGTRLPESGALIIERVLNLAATSAGL